MLAACAARSVFAWLLSAVPSVVAIAVITRVNVGSSMIDTESVNWKCEIESKKLI